MVDFNKNSAFNNLSEADMTNINGGGAWGGILGFVGSNIASSAISHVGNIYSGWKHAGHKR